MQNEDYLKQIGKNFKEIRELFGWRQEDAADRIGVSRSKIVTIENDPKKLGVCEAQSLFMACDYELFKAKQTLEKIKKSRNKSIISGLLASSTFLTSPLFASALIGLLAALKPKSLTKMIPIVGGIFGSVWGTTTAKIKREKELEELTEKGEIEVSTFIESMIKTLKELEENLLQFFLIEEWNSHLIYQKIHSEKEILEGGS